MKEIQLTQGQVAIVDDSDFDRLNQFNWQAHWSPCTMSYYAIRSVRYLDEKRHTVSMARQILGLESGDPRQADHIHHNTLDNRRLELRIVTHQKNSFNRASAKGYYWDKQHKKYRAQIFINGHNVYLGDFDDPKYAHAARLEAKEKYHLINSGEVSHVTAPSGT